MAQEAINSRPDTAPIAGIRRGRVLFIAAALHVCNDAFFAVMYPLMPFIAAELGLSYGEVGLIKTAFTGSSALLQLPAGLLAVFAAVFSISTFVIGPAISGSDTGKGKPTPAKTSSGAPAKEGHDAHH